MIELSDIKIDIQFHCPRSIPRRRSLRRKEFGSHRISKRTTTIIMIPTKAHHQTLLLRRTSHTPPRWKCGPAILPCLNFPRRWLTTMDLPPIPLPPSPALRSSPSPPCPPSQPVLAFQTSTLPSPTSQRSLPFPFPVIRLNLFKAPPALHTQSSFAQSARQNSSPACQMS